MILSGLPGEAPGGPAALAQGGDRVYLPVLVSPPSANIFGVEITKLARSRGFDLLREAGSRWVRRNSLRWKDIEPEEGKGYRWDAPRIKSIEEDFRVASESGLNLIAVVHGSPRWATAPYAADCAPINPAKVQAFARFMVEAVRRYSAPPYNVIYWELINEPDAYIFSSDSVYGCWGVKEDPYYGGEAYGRMLKTVAAAMKAANPNIKILNGGLLLDKAYNPADPATRSGRFFEGMLRAGAGASFDILSFHSYDYYKGSGQPLLGPRVDWRVGYLRDLLARYKVPVKPMIRTETALLCIEVNPECRWAQADYAARTFARAHRDGILANIWYVYDFDSYHNTAMIEPFDVFVPRPTYFAYRYALDMLVGTRYLGPLTGLPSSVEGYRFQRANDTVIVFWTDGQPLSFSLSLAQGETASCSDRDGGPFACVISGGRLTMTARQSPQYVVLR